MFAHGSGGIEVIMAEMAWWQEQEDSWSHYICTRGQSGQEVGPGCRPSSPNP